MPAVERHVRDRLLLELAPVRQVLVMVVGLHRRLLVVREPAVDAEGVHVPVREALHHVVAHLAAEGVAVVGPRALRVPPQHLLVVIDRDDVVVDEGAVEGVALLHRLDRGLEVLAGGRGAEVVSLARERRQRHRRLGLEVLSVGHVVGEGAFVGARLMAVLPPRDVVVAKVGAVLVGVALRVDRVRVAWVVPVRLVPVVVGVAEVVHVLGMRRRLLLLPLHARRPRRALVAVHRQRLRPRVVNAQVILENLGRDALCNRLLDLLGRLPALEGVHIARVSAALAAVHGTVPHRRIAADQRRVVQVAERQLSLADGPCGGTLGSRLGRLGDLGHRMQRRLGRSLRRRSVHHRLLGRRSMRCRRLHNSLEVLLLGALADQSLRLRLLQLQLLHR
mmetsp:Transcript_14848/g.34896  ORF Transcript_14848/g.34896 Transcript_14848/m.34896 type:complete len:391 (-) Transcript_14848:438-1610(-)